MDLLSNAEKVAIKLKKEQELAEIKINIKGIAKKKLTINSYLLKKRTNSFKGRVTPFL